jgi:hypothetical protein
VTKYIYLVENLLFATRLLNVPKWRFSKAVLYFLLKISKKL